MDLQGMNDVLDFEQSRKARSERSELFRSAADDLMTLLEHQRASISEEFMTFLIAMAISEQALYYAATNGNAKAGSDFIEQLYNTTRQMFEVNAQSKDFIEKRPPVQLCSKPAQVVEFSKQGAKHPLE